MNSSKELQKKDDSELITAYKRGEEEVLGELFQRYMSLIYGVCLKYLKDREDAKDAVMQIFERLPLQIKQYEITHFKSWLYVTSRNHCLMVLRSRKGKTTDDISSFLMESAVSEHLVEGEDEKEQNLVVLEKCMEELGNEQKQCVQLFYIQQKCYKEIVAVTAFDYNQVKSHIQNGKRNLKQCMERNGKA